MKTDFNINVNIRIGLTEQLAGFMERVMKLEDSSQTSSNQTSGPSQNLSERKGLEPDENPSPTLPEREGLKPDETPSPGGVGEASSSSGEVEGAAAAFPTEQNLREAMHRLRQRIEGEDYKANPGSEGYKKYHGPLTEWLKNTADTVGGVRNPIRLPPETRAAFIRQCELTVLLPDGTIGIQPQF